MIEVNSSYCLYPRVSHGLRPKFVGGMQDPYYPRFSCVTNHAASHADAENSFLALLSGPPSLLQCEFHELSDSKPCTSSANFLAAGGNFVVDSVGSGTFLTTTKGLLTEKFSNHKMQIKGDAFPAITSRAMIGLSSGVNYVFPDSQRADTSVQPSVPCIEKAREPISSKSQCCGTTPASNLNICSSDIQAMPNVALEGSSSKTATPFMSGCPRVFCVGKSECLNHVFSYWLRDSMFFINPDTCFFIVHLKKAAVFFSAIQGFLVLFAHAIVTTCLSLNFVR